MIALATNDLRTSSTWQERFTELLPAVQRRAQWVLRGLRADEREECVAEVTASAVQAYARLAAQQREHVASAVSLVDFAVRQLRAGRRVGCKLNCRDLTSPYAQRRHGMRVARLDRFDCQADTWKEVVVEDRHVGPTETAIARLDFDSWLSALPPRLRHLAETLATGEQSGKAAKLIGVSAGRVSQLRHKLEESWLTFQGEVQPALCAA